MPGEQDNQADSLPFIGPDGITQKPTAEPEKSLAADAMDRLAQNDRVQLESKMLGAGKLTDDQVADVRTRVKAYMDKTGATAARISKETNYSKAVLSEWLAGKYAGDNDKVTRVFNDWMERDARRSTAQRGKDFVSTKVAEAMLTLVNQADKQCMIGVIVAPSGAGKTTVLKVLAEKMRGVYIYCDSRMSAREFLRSLAEALGGFVRSSVQTRAQYQRHILKTLTGTRRMILVDEAHQLGDDALNCIRSLHDQAQVPFALAGTADIIRKTDDRSDGRGQFASRCIFYNAIDNIRDVGRPDGGKSSGGAGAGVGGGRDLLFTVEEIRAFFESKKIRLADDALMRCWAIACLPNEGTLRSLDKLLAIVFEMDPELELVQLRHIRAAMRMKFGVKLAGFIETVVARNQDAAKVA